MYIDLTPLFLLLRIVPFILILSFGIAFYCAFLGGRK